MDVTERETAHADYRARIEDETARAIAAWIRRIGGTLYPHTSGDHYAEAIERGDWRKK